MSFLLHALHLCCGYGCVSRALTWICFGKLRFIWKMLWLCPCSLDVLNWNKLVILLCKVWIWPFRAVPKGWPNFFFSPPGWTYLPTPGAGTLVLRNDEEGFVYICQGQHVFLCSLFFWRPKSNWCLKPEDLGNALNKQHLIWAVLPTCAYYRHYLL